MLYIQNVKSVECIRQSIKNNLDLMEDIKTIFQCLMPRLMEVRNTVLKYVGAVVECTTKLTSIVMYASCLN